MPTSIGGVLNSQRNPWGLPEGAAEHNHGFARIVKWLASLSPVIEGWKHAARRDSNVDELLEAFPQYVNFVKQLATRVLSYEPRLLEASLPDFFPACDEIIMWAHILH